MTVYKHELRSNLKSFLIWTICIFVSCLGCILLYGSVEESLTEMGDIFANMGAMSAAFGMDRVSINTMTGYFATEVAMIHALGGAMFAAILGSNMLSKEEYGHTSEFLMTLPLSRTQVVISKALALVSGIVLFQIICTSFYLCGFVMMKEEIPWEKMMLLSGTQLLLFLEIAALSYFLSACFRKNMMGVGLGLTLLFFAADMMCRLIPAIENMKYATPFYFSNGADIFSETEISPICFLVAGMVILLSFAGAGVVYGRKDFVA